MSEISLRDYFHKLDNLLRTNAADEVIHHCRHLLQYFPKNVAAYRYLGRALLINGRYEDAGAVFRRVLSAIPDDYDSNLGLGEVYDHVRKADEAIWYTERAFEQEPNNQKVLDNLRDLYRRYRNIANARVQLTSAAVARQALRNRQYDQAVETLRNALDRRPDRVDLRLLLARTLWESGERVDAAEAALDVLQVLPDCVEANRILTQLWLDEDRPSDAQRYLNRIEALDPYLALELAQGHTPDDNAFHLEELDYRASAQAALTGAQPDWLSGIAPDAEPGTASPAEQEDWSNWMSSMLATQNQQDVSSPLSDTTNLEDEALPDSHDDWMASMAQNAVTDALTPATRSFSESNAVASSDLSESVDDLFGEFAMDADEPEPAPIDIPQVEDDAEPTDDAISWLREAGVEIPEEVFSNPDDVFNSDEALQFAETPDNEMDWLSEFEDEQPASSGLERTVPEENDQLAWLSDVDAEIEKVANAPALDSPINTQAEPEPIPDWLEATDTFLDEAFGIESLDSSENADPQGAFLTEEATDGGRATSELDNWFDSTSGEQADHNALNINTGDLPNLFDDIEETAPDATGEMLPDWLNAMESEPGVETDDETPSTTSSLRGLTARLNEMGFDVESSAGQERYEPTGQTANLEGMEEWMRQFNQDVPAEPQSDTPEWLTQIEGDISAGDHGDEETFAAEADAVTDDTAAETNISFSWVSELEPADEDGSGESETEPEPEAVDEVTEDWFAQPAAEHSGEDALDQDAEIFSEDAPAAPAEEFDWLAAVAAEDSIHAELHDVSSDEAAAAVDLTDEDLDALFQTSSESVEGVVMNDENLDALFGDNDEEEAAPADEFADFIAEGDLEVTSESEPEGEFGEHQPEPAGAYSGEEDDLAALFSDAEREADAVAEAEDQPMAESTDDIGALISQAEHEAAEAIQDVDQIDIEAEDDLDALFAEAEAQARELATEDEGAESGELPDWLSELQPEEPVAEDHSAIPGGSVEEFDALFSDMQVSPDAGFEESEDVEPITPSEFGWSDEEPIADEFLEAEGEEVHAVSEFGQPIEEFLPEDGEQSAHEDAVAPEDVPLEPAFSKVDADEFVSKSDSEFGDDLSDELGDLLGEERQAAEFELAAATTFEDDLSLEDDFEPANAEFEALDLDEFGETVEPVSVSDEALDMAPAENAPDWLNAMVPGLDLDYDASEDEPVESEFADESEYEGSLIEPAADASETEEETDQATPERNFGWLVDIVEEETQQVTAVKERSAFAKFIFNRLPRWFKREAAETSAADTNGDHDEEVSKSQTDTDLPEWLR